MRSSSKRIYCINPLTRISYGILQVVGDTSTSLSTGKTPTTANFMQHLFHWTLILVLGFGFAACNGQGKTNLPFESKAISIGQLKLTKTQGSSEYANIHCSLRDKSGNLWFGTTGEGVYRYDGKFFTQFTLKDGLSNNVVWCMAEDKDGNMWFGTDDGISRFDGAVMSSIPIDAANENDFLSQNSSNPTSRKNDVWSIMQDKKGMLWFGTRNDLYLSDGKSFTRFLNNNKIINKDTLQLKMIDCMLEDKQGIIWLASGMGLGQDGISRYNPMTGELTSQKPYGNKWIRTVKEDHAGNIIIVTRLNGVCRYDPASGTFVNFTEQAGIDNKGVTTIYNDSKGNLWIATELGSGQIGEDGGLWKYDGKTFTRFTTLHGLIHNGVWSMVEDRPGNLWIGTRNVGLCRYDGKKFTAFSE